MRLLICIVSISLSAIILAEGPLIDVNQPCLSPKDLSVLKYNENLVGKSLAEVLGPGEIEAIVVCRPYANEKYAKYDKETIRARITKANCLGSANIVGWHCAPWSKGYITMKTGKTYEIEILLSGIMINGIIFE